jgi:hypothetical protein
MSQPEITSNTTSFEGPALGDFFKAMAAAQTDMGPVFKDAANPAFKSKYASLAAVCDAVLPSMNKHGLTILQAPGTASGEVTVETIIGHSSGTWMRTVLALKPMKGDPQGVGSAITYGRRYALLSLAGVAPEDDDGSAASASTGPGKMRAAETKRSGEWERLTAGLNDCHTVADLEAFTSANASAIAALPPSYDTSWADALSAATDYCDIADGIQRQTDHDSLKGYWDAKKPEIRALTPDKREALAAIADAQKALCTRQEAA